MEAETPRPSFLQSVVYTQRKKNSVSSLNKSKNKIINLTYSTCWNWFTKQFSNSLDLNKERKIVLNLFTRILLRHISWCIIIGFSRNILFTAESLYRDIIVIVSHVSWLYRIVRYPAIPSPIVNAVTVQQAILTQCSFLLWVQWAPHGSNARSRPLSLALGDELDHRQDEHCAGADRHPVLGHSGEGTMESSKSAGFI